MSQILQSAPVSVINLTNLAQARSDGSAPVRTSPDMATTEFVLPTIKFSDKSSVLSWIESRELDLQKIDNALREATTSLKKQVDHLVANGWNATEKHQNAQLLERLEACVDFLKKTKFGKQYQQIYDLRSESPSIGRDGVTMKIFEKVFPGTSNNLTLQTPINDFLKLITDPSLNVALGDVDTIEKQLAELESIIGEFSISACEALIKPLIEGRDSVVAFVNSQQEALMDAIQVKMLATQRRYKLHLILDALKTSFPSTFEGLVDTVVQMHELHFQQWREVLAYELRRDLKRKVDSEPEENREAVNEFQKKLKNLMEEFSGQLGSETSASRHLITAAYDLQETTRGGPSNTEGPQSPLRLEANESDDSE